MTEAEILEWMDAHNDYMYPGYHVRNVDGNLVLDVDGDVDFYRLLINTFPFKFGIVKGNFFCGRVNLKSLIGAPDVITGEFNCSDNLIKSLEGHPMKVMGKVINMNNHIPLSQYEIIANFDVNFDTYVSDYENLSAHVRKWKIKNIINETA